MEQLIHVVDRLPGKFPGLCLWLIGDGPNFRFLSDKAAKANQKLCRQLIVMKGFIENVSKMDKVPELILGTGRVAAKAIICGSSVIPVNHKRMRTLVITANLMFYQRINFVNIHGLPPDELLLGKEIGNYFGMLERNVEEHRMIMQKVRNDCNVETIARKIGEVYGSALENNNRKN